jgi:RIO kinase 1
MALGRFAFGTSIKDDGKEMTKIRLQDVWDDDFDLSERRTRGRAEPKRARPGQPPRAGTAQTAPAAAAPADAEDAFHPTFTSSFHEHEWILNYLGPFHADGIIQDVLRQVKGGKEANVYCCEPFAGTGLGLIAAKVYRPRMFRQLRQDARYRNGRLILDAEGNEVRDDRRLRAVAKRTRYGQEVLHTSWLEHEFQALTLLHRAGADVPRPIARSENTILMEYVGEVGEPAPPLYHVRLDRTEARTLFERLVHNIEIMLAQGLVHADLSAYNVLYWDGEVTVIDFPQAVDVRRNPDAPDLLGRDVERLYGYFARYGVRAEPGRLARALWARHVRRGSAAERARERAAEEVESREED